MKKDYNYVVIKFGNRKEELFFLQEDVYCGDVKCYGELDYFFLEYIINIFVLISVYFIYLLLSMVKWLSIVLYFIFLIL